MCIINHYVEFIMYLLCIYPHCIYIQLWLKMAWFLPVALNEVLAWHLQELRCQSKSLYTLESVRMWQWAYCQLEEWMMQLSSQKISRGSPVFSCVSGLVITIPRL